MSEERKGKMKPIARLLVANRGEIAERIIRAAHEIGIHTIAVYSSADARSAHRHLADEAVELASDAGAVAPYLDVAEIVEAARTCRADAVHPGYGFLSESPALASALDQAGISFVGPTASTLETLGSKVLAKDLAREAGLPVLEASPPLSDDRSSWHAAAREVGFPLLCKASWGGGGRGMRLVDSPAELSSLVEEARAEAESAFGDPEVYLERYVEDAQHIEVQVVADEHGTVVHLFDRDCSVQRRNQKVIEVAPSGLPDEHRSAMCAQAVELARAADYRGVGTVEFLYDLARGAWYFIEVNPRIQVEHPITEAVTGIDLVRAQLLIAQGGEIGDVDRSGVPTQEMISARGHAIELRVTTEDPSRDFAPASGVIESLHVPGGPGVRVDGVTAHVGDSIGTAFDTLFKKVVVWAPTWETAVERSARVLDESCIVGVPTNLPYLRSIVRSREFRSRRATTPMFGRYVPSREDLGPVSGLVDYLAEVHAKGHADLIGRSPATTASARAAVAPAAGPGHATVHPSGTKQLLDSMGADRFATWVRDQERLFVTDTTLRDAHQSLLATRLRTHDILAIAPAMAHRLPGLFSMECWGGATFDVALRFLQEDPWERLAAIREAVPNVLLQMLLRGGSAVGYGLYPEGVVRRFVHEAADTGIDVFRVFDSLNNVDTMRGAIEAVRETSALCEGAICYTADLFDPERPTYDLAYYLELGKRLELAGCHILAIKDMAGVCRPAAARQLVSALRETTGLPVHFHTHDTSGFSAASLYAAAEAGADIVDAAIDSMSGLTGQPPLGPLIRSQERQQRDTGLDPAAVVELAAWWEATRRLYAPFESEMRAGTGDVYVHEIPGGQYTNLREQARRLGFGDDRWREIVQAYAAANRLLGDIPKVTPVSKVVGDLALMMVGAGVTEKELLSGDVTASFPDSVVGLLRGDLGSPPGGFPEVIRARALGAGADARSSDDEAPPELDEPEWADGASAAEIREGLTTHLYPDLWSGLVAARARWGDVSVLPTHAFYFGLDEGDEVAVEDGDGRQFTIECRSIREVQQGTRYEYRIAGRPHVVIVSPQDEASAERAVDSVRRRETIEVSGGVVAPFDGVVVACQVEPGSEVEGGCTLLVIEAMKMRSSITSPCSGVVAEVPVAVGDSVRSGDLLAVVTARE